MQKEPTKRFTIELQEKQAEFMERYERFKPHLQRLIEEGYRGDFVYLKDGKVLDTDRSKVSLHKRVSEIEKFPDEYIFLVTDPADGRYHGGLI